MFSNMTPNIRSLLSTKKNLQILATPPFFKHPTYDRGPSPFGNQPSQVTWGKGDSKRAASLRSAVGGPLGLEANRCLRMNHSMKKRKIGIQLCHFFQIEIPYGFYPTLPTPLI